jgi:hypothetical protein
VENKYVGDVGDFGKYGLLRQLGAGLALGIVWYLVPDEGQNRDGRHIRYLNIPDDTCALYGVTPCSAAEERRYLRHYRSCDPGLYDCLRDLIAKQQRSVNAVAAAGILPPATVFVDEPVPSSIGREPWLKRALDATHRCDLVFLDPDNGLGGPNLRRSALTVKYALYEEVAMFFMKGHSLVIYQHCDRMPDSINLRRRTLAKALNVPATEIHALHYGRGTARVFFAVAAVHDRSVICERIDAFLGGPWAAHFHRV